MKPNLQNTIYLFGVAALGLFYNPIKEALGGKWLFVLSAIIYLFALRILGTWVTKRFTHGSSGNDA